jgi:hypothetical protein
MGSEDMSIYLQKAKEGITSMFGVLLAASMLLGFFSSVQAYEVEGLFNSEVKVFDRSPEQRMAGIRQALENVLIKVSGNRNVVFAPGVVPSENQLEGIVDQFRYSEIESAPKSENQAQSDIPVEAGTEGSDQAQAPQPGLNLWVGFDANAVLRLLQKSNLPVWDKMRPLSLIWLAVQDGSERYLLESEIHRKTKKHIEKLAGERGLPIVFPLMDLEDRGALSLTDIWGDFADSINIASQRYGVDAVIVGRVFHESEAAWLARWSFYQGQVVSRWESRGENKESAISEGIHGVSDVLARRYSQVLLTNLEPPLIMTLVDITDFNQYAKAISYLEGLTQVVALNVTKVNHDQVEINLSIRGNKQGLEKVIGLGGVLNHAGDMVYRLRP